MSFPLSRKTVMRSSGWLRMAVLAQLICVSMAWAAEPVEQWLPLQDRNLVARAAGNALDFSALVAPGPAGRYGWLRGGANDSLVFEKSSSAQRFFATTMVFGPGNGKIPDKAGVAALVTELKRTGYNAVRLHFIDALLMDDRERDFDFDPEQFDRLHDLLAQLKAAGIYWIVDGLTSDNAAYGNVRPHRFIKKHHAKLDVLLSDAGFEHWTRLVDRLWGTKNPYTGLAPINDPAMLGMILVNEGSIGFLATTDGNRYPASLATGFRQWLQVRYRDDTALRSAWGSELRGGESLGAGVELPDAVRGKSMRDKDFARFVGDTERAAFARMEKHVRQLGFGGLTTAFNNWGFVSADVSRSAAPWIDMHGYHDVPSNHGQPGSKNRQSGLLETQARGVRELSNARQWGKPFTVTEYGQPFWNGSRYEMTALVPSMAAHQGWSAISLFAEVPVLLDYGPSTLVRRQAIYPFGIGADPILRAGERLAAVLFMRGDVTRSTHRIRLHVDAEKLFSRSGGWEQVPEAISRLAFVAPIGLDFGAMPDRATAGELSLDLGAGPPSWAVKVDNALQRAGIDWRTDALAPLRAAGIVDATNRSRPEANFFESDTGELRVDARAGSIQVGTARSSVIVTKGGDADNPGFTVRGASGPALFAIASLDGLALAKSRHLLVWVLTDAMNSGMKFQDAGRTMLSALGSFPPQVRTVQASLHLDSTQARGLKAWPLNLAGERRRELPLKSDDKGTDLVIDTAKLPDGPALFFEIAAE